MNRCVSLAKQVFPYRFVSCDDNWVKPCQSDCITPNHDSRSEKPQRSATLLVSMLGTFAKYVKLEAIHVVISGSNVTL